MLGRGKKKDKPESKQRPSIQTNPGFDTGQGANPDYRRASMVLQGDAKGHALNKLLASDASNPIKSSNENPFNLSVMDVMGSWESAESEEEIIKLFLNGRLAVGGTEIEGGYRINKMAEGFKMTLTYTEAFKAWTLLGGQPVPTAPPALNEGSKQGK